jgi:hypothetical protein
MRLFRRIFCRSVCFATPYGRAIPEQRGGIDTPLRDELVRPGVAARQGTAPAAREAGNIGTATLTRTGQFAPTPSLSAARAAVFHLRAARRIGHARVRAGAPGSHQNHSPASTRRGGELTEI